MFDGNQSILAPPSPPVNGLNPIKRHNMYEKNKPGNDTFSRMRSPPACEIYAEAKEYINSPRSCKMKNRRCLASIDPEERTQGNTKDMDIPLRRQITNSRHRKLTSPLTSSPELFDKVAPGACANSPVSGPSIKHWHSYEKQSERSAPDRPYDSDSFPGAFKSRSSNQDTKSNDMRIAAVKATHQARYKNARSNDICNDHKVGDNNQEEMFQHVDDAFTSSFTNYQSPDDICYDHGERREPNRNHPKVSKVYRRKRSSKTLKLGKKIESREEYLEHSSNQEEEEEEDGREHVQLSYPKLALQRSALKFGHHMTLDNDDSSCSNASCRNEYYNHRPNGQDTNANCRQNDDRSRFGNVLKQKTEVEAYMASPKTKTSRLKQLSSLKARKCRERGANPFEVDLFRDGCSSDEWDELDKVRSQNANERRISSSIVEENKSTYKQDQQKQQQRHRTQPQINKARGHISKETSTTCLQSDEFFVDEAHPEESFEGIVDDAPIVLSLSNDDTSSQSYCYEFPLWKHAKKTQLAENALVFSTGNQCSPEKTNSPKRKENSLLSRNLQVRDFVPFGITETDSNKYQLDTRTPSPVISLMPSLSPTHMIKSNNKRSEMNYFTTKRDTFNKREQQQLDNGIHINTPDENSFTSPKSRSGNSAETNRRKTATTPTTSPVTSICPAPPRPVIQWKRGEKIGEGTFGKVYMGLNEVTGELFAVKEIQVPTDTDAKNSRITKLEEEISLMKDLNHKHIVRYRGTDRRDTKLHIFMEYIPGGSIASMLAQFGVFNEDLIRLYIRQILEGVEYLHSKGIVHRDIKGPNVLVNEQGVAKLADFGCSKQLQDVRSTTLEESLHAIRGSVPWMAPEVIKQTGHGRKADIWSVGATMVEMASARHPWPAFTSDVAVMYNIATSESSPPVPEHLSDTAKGFLQKCFVINPDDRASATELLQHVFLREPSSTSSIQQQNTLDTSESIQQMSSNVTQSAEF